MRRGGWSSSTGEPGAAEPTAFIHLYQSFPAESLGSTVLDTQPHVHLLLPQHVRFPLVETLPLRVPEVWVADSLRWSLSSSRPRSLQLGQAPHPTPENTCSTVPVCVWRSATVRPSFLPFPFLFCFILGAPRWHPLSWDSLERVLPGAPVPSQALSLMLGACPSPRQGGGGRGHYYTSRCSSPALPSLPVQVTSARGSARV